MTNPLVRIHNSQTDEIIDRQMTAEELAEFKLDSDKTKIAIAEAKKTAEAKAELLERLGITAEEAALLLG